MPSFGETLRRERKSRNIRLRDIAESTKISSIYLRALESDDFAQLPGTVFNRGYVRAYAEFVGIDAEAMVAAYNHEERRQEAKRAESDPGLQAARARAARGGSSRARLVGVTAAVLAGVAAGLLWLTLPGREAGTETAVPAAEAPEALAEEPPMRAAAIPLEGAPGDPAPSGIEEAGVEEPPAPEPAAVPPPQASPSPNPLAADRPAADAVPQPPPETATTASAPKAPAPGALALTVPESGVGSRVVDRMLEDPRSTFARGERVYFWALVAGGSPGTVVRHVWLREGTPISDIPIEVGGPHWRTYTWQTMRDDCDGDWQVEVRDASERILARGSFACRP